MNNRLFKYILGTRIYSVYKYLRYFDAEKKLRRTFKETYRKNVEKCAVHKFDPSGKTLFIDCNDSSLTIYLIGLVYFFGKKGYNVVINNNVNFIQRSNMNKSLIYLFDFVTIQQNFQPDVKTIILTDITNYKNKHANAFKIFFLSPDIFFRKYPPLRDEILLPFMHHPETFINGQLDKINEYRRNTKMLWCFFSGNFDVDTYTKTIHNSFFGIENRYNLIGEIRNHFSSEKLAILNNANDIFSLENTESKKIVITDWTWHPHKTGNLYSRIKSEEWLSVLSRCNFFIGLPGVYMPMCHNLIEAMSVGTIPILEYADQFYPELTHMENAILFRGKKDLIEKLEFVLTLSNDEVKKMRENVIEYYEQYLNIENVVSQIICKSGNSFTMYYFDEYKSVEAYRNRKYN